MRAHTHTHTHTHTSPSLWEHSTVDRHTLVGNEPPDLTSGVDASCSLGTEESRLSRNRISSSKLSFSLTVLRVDSFLLMSPLSLSRSRILPNPPTFG